MDFGKVHTSAVTAADSLKIQYRMILKKGVCTFCRYKLNSMMIRHISTQAFKDQRPGTSGLRKKMSVFQQPHYLENFIQSVFDVLHISAGRVLVLGGDGRFGNDHAIQIILKMALANNVSHILMGRNGWLSTPAISHLIRKYKGAIIIRATITKILILKLRKV